MIRRWLRRGALLIGFGVVIALIAQQGAATIASAFVAMGWGLFALPICVLPHILGAALSWRQLLPRNQALPFGAVLRALWVCQSVETLVPGGGVGGEAVKIRLAMKSGVPGAVAVASVVVDIAVQTLVLCFWGAIGLALLFGHGSALAVAWPAFIGLVLLILGFVALFIVQRFGLFGRLVEAVARFIRGPVQALVLANANQVDAGVRALFSQPRRIAAATAIRCASRIFLLVEFWLGAQMMAAPIAFFDVTILVGIVAALRAAAVIVPGGWGVQEGGYVVLGGLLGLPADALLAISLATRAREAIIGVPALALWHFMESKGAVSGRKPSAD
jgi:putative membrane protein